MFVTGRDGRAMNEKRLIAATNGAWWSDGDLELINVIPQAARDNLQYGIG